MRSEEENMPLRPFDELEQALGYRFRDPALLEHALTHSSFAHETGLGDVADNERLEFLGDSVLGFLISDFLYQAHPNIKEGDLSKLKAFLVSSANLLHYSKELSLGAYLQLGRGEEKTGGREKPALLVDTLEALLAAIYLDGGLEALRELVHRLFKVQIEDADESGQQIANFKSTLQETLQSRSQPPVRYKLVEQSGPDHERLFTVEAVMDGESIASGQGGTKKGAEQAAARAALEVLQIREAEGSPE
jgi:ribonuclease-3